MDKGEYYGYETGPIRPPSEAASLLLRLTRNCPWNKCRFCGLYKGERYSERPAEHIKRDIDIIKKWTDYFQAEKDGMADTMRPEDGGTAALNQAENWVYNRMKSVFLQDANSLVIKPEKMIDILTYLRGTFPAVDRVTSYARSQTISRISDEDLAAIGAAGLNRIHIGLESGCDEVLKMVRKGADRETHIMAGQKVKKAGIELSEYYMPGLGGVEYLKQNAEDTADALNRINPDFIRIRMLAIPENLQIAEDYRTGRLTRANDIKMAEELLLMLKSLEGVDSYVKSDHIINLFPEVRGRLPEDRDKMTSVIEHFLALPEEDQIIYRVGRRMGVLALLKGIENDKKRQSIKDVIESNGINSGNIDAVCDSLMMRYI